MQAHPRDQRRPLVFDKLKAVLHTLRRVCVSRYERILFKAAFALTFYGAYCLSEVVAPARNSPGSACLRVRDITMGRDYMEVFLRRSKTDQEGKGVTSIIRSIPDRRHCGVRLLRRYLAVRPVAPGPLFIHHDGSCLSKYQFRVVFRAVLHQAGLPAGHFGSHSFRIGAATTASLLGFSEEGIKKVGRWRSKAYRSYLRPDGC